MDPPPSLPLVTMEPVMMLAWPTQAVIISQDQEQDQEQEQDQQNPQNKEPLYQLLTSSCGPVGQDPSFWQSLTHPGYTDVTLVLEDGQLPVNRAVLAALSPLLATTLQHSHDALVVPLILLVIMLLLMVTIMYLL